VRRYVESLILSYEQAGDFLDKPPAICGHSAGGNEVGSWRARRIGPYQIIGEIGEGGMGAVYLAERADDEYQKKVAIKRVHSGLDPRFMLARFKAERQILANLDHPNIARLLDGGSTEDQQPYLVMEYVEGLPLDRYCNHHNLTVTARLQLFRAVCSAVQYAHQNLVIHRDIKPANILVTSDGVPKLLDFGVAKILTPDARTSPALRTMPMVRLLTPEYASPEQLRGDAISTASDIYSLGVVLYEILAGRRPERRLHGEPEEVAQPSAANSQAVTSSESLNLPEGSPEKLRRRLAGDLDNIVLMALRHEAGRRYASVEQLSEDIRRHLEGLPVFARADTLSYRSSKFIKRHKVAVVAALLLALSLITGAAVTLREASIARAQQARAERRFNDVRKLANSLMFDIHDAIRDLPGSTRARQLVVSNALTYLDSLAGEARSDLSLQRELADAYERVGAVQGEPYKASLGDTAGALASYRKAGAIRRAIVSAATPDRIKYAANCRTIATLQLLSSDSTGAIASAQESVSIAQALLKSDPGNREALPELAADYSGLGNILAESTGSSDKSLVAENYRRALQIDQELAKYSADPIRSRSVAVDEFHIGRHLKDAGYRREAIGAFKRALGILDGLASGSTNTQARRDVATVRSNLGDTLQMDGDAKNALANFLAVLDIITPISTADPENGDARLGIGEACLNVGSALVMLGERNEAHGYLLRAISILEKAAVKDPKQESVNYDLTIAYVWAASAELDEREALEGYNKALAIDQRLAKANTGDSYWRENEAEVRVKIGDFCRKTAQLASAAESYGRAVALAEPIVSSQGAKYALADAYFGLGQIAALRALRPNQPRDEQAAKWDLAKSWYQRCSDAWRQIRNPAAVSPTGFECGDPREAERQLVRCNAALAALRIAGPR
jgi:non-specific serine/threonine protein kinase/serine/threonine-protein kinase